MKVIKWILTRTTWEVLLSVGKIMGLYLYISQMDLEGSSRVGALCIYVMNDMHDICFTWYACCRSHLVCMLLAMLVMMMSKVNDNACDLLLSLLVVCGVMGFHIEIALGDLDWGYE